MAPLSRRASCESYQLGTEDQEDDIEGTEAVAPQSVQSQACRPTGMRGMPIFTSASEGNAVPEPDEDTQTPCPSEENQRQDSGSSADGDEPRVTRLSTFVLKPTSSVLNFDIQIDHILSTLPKIVKYYLFSMALLPMDTFSKYWHRVAYRIFRWVITLCFVTRWLLSVKMALLRYGAMNFGFPVEIIEGFGLFLAFQLWLVVMRQLERNGHVLLMLYDVTRRGFRWESSVRGLKRFLFTSTSVIILQFLGIFDSAAQRKIPCMKVQDLAEAKDIPPHLRALFQDEVCASSILWYVLTIPVVWHIAIGVFWCARLMCHFHKHELMWYANALAEMLKIEDVQPQLMDQLSSAETSITNRLRQASTTWVKSVILTLGGFSLMILVLVTYLMSDIQKEVIDFSLAVSNLILLVSLLLLCGAPVATVAEVFEYDVLHALNNPLVVKNAQRHFGQQLLSHLHTLGWGFRFGQTVIDLRIIVNIVAALLISVITSVSQAMLQQFKSM